VALFLRILIGLFALLALASGAGAVSADTFAQAATATPTLTATVGAAATAVPCTTTPAGIQIVLENPSPGDTLPSGAQIVMNGIAYDTGSTSGPGISSVTIYLGARDAGGLALGTATLGLPNPAAPPNSRRATRLVQSLF